MLNTQHTVNNHVVRHFVYQDDDTTDYGNGIRVNLKRGRGGWRKSVAEI